MSGIFTKKNVLMATIYIDNKPYEVKEGKNMLEVCLTLGFDLPYFCWHPAMGSVGACRQCAVKSYKDEDDSKGRLVMSCMEPVRDQARISISDQEAREFRARIIEWLMINHPHDCAVCDEGGSCHLQDMTVMTGHNYRNFRYKKRTYRNQYLGPFLNHEMNRCIQCYRCVRFYKDYAGGKDLDVFAAHDHVYFGRSESGVLENEFSGNLAEVCPTGVFTDKTLKMHYSRKWDMVSAPSVCHGCGVGCNIIAGERYGELRQITSRYNSEVNGYFICDRGRFGYEFVNSPERITKISVRDKMGESDPTKLLQHIAARIREGQALGIGSPRASLESNFALRTLVGENHFYHGMSAAHADLAGLSLKILHGGPARTPSLKEVEQADAVLILGEDLTNTAPRMALAVRQAVFKAPGKEAAGAVHVPLWQDAAIREVLQDKRAPLFSFTPYPTKLDELAAQTAYRAPDTIARMGFGIAHAIDPGLTEIKRLSRETQEIVSRIAKVLQEAERPLIISGYGCGSEAVIKSAADVAWALCKKGKQARIALTQPEANSLGLAMMGGHRLESAMDAVKNKHSNVAVILENDLYRLAEKSLADAFFDGLDYVVLIDHLYHAGAEKADAILPAGTFAESDGTMVSSEGRAQRFFQVFTSNGKTRESWRWIRQIAGAGLPSLPAGKDRDLQSLKTLDDFVNVLPEVLPQFEGIQEITPPPGFRIAGQRIPRAPHRHSGRTAVYAHINVSEPKPPEDEDTPMSFTMEGFRGIQPSQMVPFFWSPGWNSVQAINKYQIEVGGPLHGGDPGKRLINASADQVPVFFAEQPEPFQPPQDHLCLIGRYYIFGSEELSIHTPGIAERAPKPHLMIHEEDARRLNLEEGQPLRFHHNGQDYELPVALQTSWPEGMIAIPAGLPGVPVLDMPVLVTVSKVQKLHNS